MGSLNKVVLWLPYMKWPLGASRGLKKAKMAFSTSKNLNFRAQRLYLTPTIEMAYQDGFSDQSCSMIALHDFASRDL